MILTTPFYDKNWKTLTGKVYFQNLSCTYLFWLVNNKYSEFYMDCSDETWYCSEISYPCVLLLLICILIMSFACLFWLFYNHVFEQQIQIIIQSSIWAKVMKVDVGGGALKYFSCVLLLSMDILTILCAYSYTVSSVNIVST